MAVYKNREAYIPYRRGDLIELCLADGLLNPSEVPKFRSFCEILSAYHHFKFHRLLEQLKYNYSPFDPDTDTITTGAFDPVVRQQMAGKLVEDFQALLERANYFPLSKKKLKQACSEQSLIDLNTDIDFGDFERVICYCRGNTSKQVKVKKFFRTVEQSVEIFERVALLLQCEAKDYFLKQEIDTKKLKFTPEKSYIYLYKNIPKSDIDFIFPNVKTSMTWKDRLLFWVPAVGAAIPLSLRVLPQLLLIVGAILFVTFGVSEVANYKIQSNDLRELMPIMIATLSFGMTLGGFAFKQYTNYKNKQLKFQQSVTETLFFRNLASNNSVLHALIDAAEEEECKEIILVYYHLLASDRPLTPQQLDDRIEQWLEQKFGTKIDFDIQKSLQNLTAIRGKISLPGLSDDKISETPLLQYDRDGRCQVLPLEEARAAIDYIWDNIFS